MPTDITFSGSTPPHGLDLVGMAVSRKERFLDAMRAAGIEVEETQCDPNTPPIDVPCNYFHVQRSPGFQEAFDHWKKSESRLPAS